MYYDTVIKLKTRLEKPLPGKEAQFKMAPSFRSTSNNSTIKYKAGVMLLLYPVKNKLTTVFMKRTEYPGVHSGQISFPGGKCHPNDNTILKTALRETNEEFGVAEEDIEIIGALTPLYIPVSGFEVFPFVGYISETPVFKTDPTEVDYLIEIELDYLLAPYIRKTEFQKHGEFQGLVPYFEVKNHKIWGATAMIMNEFMEIYNSLN